MWLFYEQFLMFFFCFFWLLIIFQKYIMLFPTLSRSHCRTLARSYEGRVFLTFDISLEPTVWLNAEQYFKNIGTILRYEYRIWHWSIAQPDVFGKK
jgi:hypothetical protein